MSEAWNGRERELHLDSVNPSLRSSTSFNYALVCDKEFGWLRYPLMGKCLGRLL